MKKNETEIILFSMKNFNTYLDPKRKSPKPEKILNLVKKCNILFWRLRLMGDVVHLPHVSN